METNEFGPAMQELTEKQRGFVMAMIETPGCSHAEAARRAGYSDKSGGAKVIGFYQAHHPGVQAAIREEAGRRLNSLSLMAANTMMLVLQDPDAPLKEKIKAAGMVLDRTGFGAAQTINVNKTTTDRTGKAIMARIAELAGKLGVDKTKLLGPAELPESQLRSPSRNCDPEVVEGEFSEVKDD